MPSFYWNGGHTIITYSRIPIPVKRGQSQKRFVTSSFNWNRDPTIISYRRIPIPVKRGRHKSLIVLTSKMGKEVKKCSGLDLPFFGFHHQTSLIMVSPTSFDGFWVQYH